MAVSEKAWFRTGRFFHQQRIGGGLNDGWYLILRGGDIEGPFTSRYQAVLMLRNLLKAYEEMGETGGRGAPTAGCQGRAGQSQM